MMAQEPPYLLGIDIGTGSVRVGLFTVGGKLVSSAAGPITLIHPVKGWVEGKAEEYWNVLVSCTRRAVSQDLAPYVEGIVVGSTASTILGTTKNGLPCTPVVLWMDARAVQEAIEISTYLQDYSSHEWMPAKALWFLRHKGDDWKRSDNIVELADWINFRLTDVWSVSRCTAVCKWNKLVVSPSTVTDRVGEKVFAEVFEPLLKKWPTAVCNVGEPIGSLNHDAANQLGLPISTVIFEGGIDAYMAMIANNCLIPSSLSLTLGTSTVLLAPSTNPLCSNQIWGPYESPVLEDQWVVEGGQLSSGILLDWLVRLFRLSHQHLSQMAISVSPGARGLLWVENIQGNRTPYRNALAHGALFGISVDHGPAEIYRAALEATAMGAYEAFQAVESSAKNTISTIRVSGGGALDPLWLQIHADVFGKSMFYPKDPECASLRGAAVLAATGLHYYPNIHLAAETMTPSWLEINPNEENHIIYKRLIQVHKEAYQWETQAASLL